MGMPQADGKMEGWLYLIRFNRFGLQYSRKRYFILEDNCLKSSGVPGAGGFDAVFAVTLGNSSSEVGKAWSSLNVLALLVREDPRGVSLESSDPRTKEVTSAISSVQIK